MARPAYSLGISRNDAVTAIATNSHPMRFPGCRAAIKPPTLHMARIANSPATDELLGRKLSGTPCQSTPKARKAWTATRTIAQNQIATGAMSDGARRLVGRSDLTIGEAGARAGVR